VTVAEAPPVPKAAAAVETTPESRPPEPDIGPEASVPGYELLAVLGRGGMGVVYKARHTALGRVVALKMIRGPDASREEEARFQAEAEAVARLQHPNIVQIFEVGRAHGGPFFSLEYCPGGSLAKKLANRPQEPADAARLVETLARAMHEAHRHGTVHRDLKPANVLLAGPADAPLGQCVAKVSDFGLAKRLDAASGRTHTGQVLGTPSYMAPEQALGQLDRIGPLCDVYALGAILYECLTGRPPFLGANVPDTLEQVRSQEPVAPRRIQPHCPRDLETICLKALHKDPGRRYATAEALADDLHRYQGGEPIQARPVGNLERAAAWARRKPAVAGLSAAVVLVALVGLVLVLISWQAAVTAWEKEAERADSEEQATQVAVKAGEKALKALKETELARKKAEEEQLKADKARQKEKLAKEEKAVALRDSELSLYTTQLLLAYREWTSNEVALAQARLDSCPPERRGWEWRYLKKLCNGELLAVRGGSSNVCFSPDGRRLMAAALQRAAPGKPPTKTELMVWDAVTGQALAPRTFPALGVRLSPDGRFAVGVVRDDSNRPLLKRWDVETGREEWNVPAGKEARTLVFSPDSRYLAEMGVDGTTVIRDLADGKPAPARRPPEPLALAGSIINVGSTCALHPDGKQAAVVTRAGDLKLWDLSTGKVRETGVRTDSGLILIKHLSFSPDGTYLVYLGQAPLWHVIETQTGRVVLTLPAPGGASMSAVRFSPDGRKLAVTTPDSDCKVFDLAAGRELVAIRANSPRGGASDMAFSPDSFLLAVYHGDAVLRVWDASAGAEYRQLPRVGGMATALAFGPDGRYLACVCETALNEMGLTRVNVLDAWAGEYIGSFTGHKANPRCVAFLPDGARLISADSSGGLKVWERDTGRMEADLSKPGHDGMLLAVHPGGKQVAVAGWKRDPQKPGAPAASFVSVRDLDTKVELFSATEGKQIHDLRYADGGKRLLIVKAGGEVAAWDTSGWRELSRKRLNINERATLALGPDGGVLAALVQRPAQPGGGEPGGSLQLWDVAGGKRVHEISTGPHGMPALSFSPDGKRLAFSAGVRERSLHFYDIGTGRETFALHGLDFGASRVAFSPDGEAIAIGGLSQTLRVYDGGGTTDEARAGRRKALEETGPVKHLAEGQDALRRRLAGPALFHFDRAVRALPGRPVVKLQRAAALAELGRWDDADRDYAEVLRAGPAPLAVWEQSALVCLQRKGRAGYRQLCDQLLERAARAKDSQALNHVVRITTLAPGGADPQRVLKIQEDVTAELPGRPQLIANLGIACYRAGKFDEAIKHLKEAEKHLGTPDVLAFPGRASTPVRETLFLAMALHKAGKQGEAKEAYQRAVKEMDATSRVALDGLFMQPPGWDLRLHLATVRQEADQTLGIAKP
jgi:WD40 repeat protein/tetratricopeptide (TPR) repeat protein